MRRSATLSGSGRVGLLPVARPAAALLGWMLLGCGGGDSANAEARNRLEAEFGPRTPPQAVGSQDESSPLAGEPEMERQPPGASPEPDSPGRAPGDSGSAPATVSPGQNVRDPAVSPPALEAGRAQPPDVDSLLAAAEAAYSGLASLRADFSQVVRNVLLDRTREGAGVWYQAGRTRFRMEFEDPPGDLYIADGSCLWLYEPSLHDQIAVSPLGEEDGSAAPDIIGRLLSEARDGYEGVYAGVEAVAATETHSVILSPRRLPARYIDVRLWIGAADGYIRRFRVQEENETIRDVTLSRLEPGLPVADSMFEFAPPPGVPVFPSDARCG